MNIKEILRESYAEATGQEMLAERLGTLSSLPSDARMIITDILKNSRSRALMSNQSEVEEFNYGTLKEIEDRVRSYIKGAVKPVACILAKTNGGNFYAYTPSNKWGLDTFNKASKDGVFHYMRGYGATYVASDTASYREFANHISESGTAWIVFVDAGLAAKQTGRMNARQRDDKYAPSSSYWEKDTPFMRSAKEQAKAIRDTRNAITLSSSKRMTAQEIMGVLNHLKREGSGVWVDGSLYRSSIIGSRLDRITLLDLLKRKTVDVCSLKTEDGKFAELKFNIDSMTLSVG